MDQLQQLRIPALLLVDLLLDSRDLQWPHVSVVMYGVSFEWRDFAYQVGGFALDDELVLFEVLFAVARAGMCQR